MYDWHPLSELTAPYQVRYTMLTRGGIGNLRLWIDFHYPELTNEKVGQIASIYFSRFLAPLLAGDTALAAIEVVPVALGDFGFLVNGAGATGLQQGRSLPLSGVPVLTQMTGHLDPWGRRRLYIPGAPEACGAAGVLTRYGETWLSTLAAALWLGFDAERSNGSARVFIYRPALPNHRNPAFRVAGWRNVVKWRACTFLARAPQGI